jgi:uncharacterized alkaline shock family protein YloU
MNFQELILLLEDKRSFLLSQGYDKKIVDRAISIDEKYSVWLAKQIKNNAKYQHISDDLYKYIIDWARATHADIMKFTFDEASYEASEWHNNFSISDKESTSKNIVYTFKNNWTIVKLEADDCSEEGELMGHCVGTYSDKVRANKSEIYSLRDLKNKPHATIELIPVKDNSFQLSQVQGKENTKPKDEYCEMIKEWFKTIKIVNEEIKIDVYDIFQYFKEIKEGYTEVYTSFEGKKNEDEYGIPINYNLHSVHDFLSRRKNLNISFNKYSELLYEVYVVIEQQENKHLIKFTEDVIDVIVWYALNKNEKDILIKGVQAFNEFVETKFEEWLSTLPDYPKEKDFENEDDFYKAIEKYNVHIYDEYPFNRYMDAVKTVCEWNGIKNIIKDLYDKV